MKVFIDGIEITNANDIAFMLEWTNKLEWDEEKG